MSEQIGRRIFCKRIGFWCHQCEFARVCRRYQAARDDVDTVREEFWTERLGLRIVKKNDYPIYSVLSGLTQVARNHPEFQYE